MNEQSKVTRRHVLMGGAALAALALVPAAIDDAPRAEATLFLISIVMGGWSFPISLIRPCRLLFLFMVGRGKLVAPPP